MSKVLWHTMMSLDGFIAGPNDDMQWVFGVDGGAGQTSGESWDRRERCWSAGERRTSRTGCNRVSTAVPFAGRSSCCGTIHPPSLLL